MGGKSIIPYFSNDYELIDTGNRYKLERFGKYILSRPEPQAVWKPALSKDEWNKLAHTEFVRDKNNPEKGVWNTLKSMPESWIFRFECSSFSLQFKLMLTGFKHVGIFPEQSDNWIYIYNSVKKRSNGAMPCKVLNLFAYTGGASMAAAAAGADVTHVDSVKQVITWANENRQINKLKDIRWLHDDAFAFLKREARRENTYNGIILDPPAYGRGPDGEKWLLEEQMDETLYLCSRLLSQNGFLVLNLYSMGFSALIAENLLTKYFPSRLPTLEYGEHYFSDNSQTKLPLSVFARFN